MRFLASFPSFLTRFGIPSFGPTLLAGICALSLFHSNATASDVGVVIGTSGNLEVSEAEGGISDGELTLSLTNGNVRIRQNLAGDVLAGAGMVQVDSSTVDIPVALITGSQIHVDGQGGDDHLILDLSGGVPPVPVCFWGGINGVGGDSLSVTGGNATNLTFNYINAHDGDVVLDGAQLISYTGLEPIYSTLTATNVILNYSDAAETITVSDSGVPGSTTVASTAGETTTFINPTGSLTLNAGAGGADVIELAGVGSGFAADLNLDGGAGIGDTLTVTGPIATAGGDVTLAVSGGVTFWERINTGGGSFSVDADKDADGTGDFVLSGTVIAEGSLSASDGGAGDWFGSAVAIDGDTAVIGALYDDDGGTDAGAVYVFERSGTNWTQQVKLTASDAGGNDVFGRSVSINGDTLVVGASGDDGGGVDTGSAYVFVRVGTDWVQQAKLTAADRSAYDLFGFSVSGSGDTVVVGAPYDDASYNDAGSAYVFVRSGTNWTQQVKLVAADGNTAQAERANFGISVSYDNEIAIIGAFRDDAAGVESGSAYLFERTNGNGPVWMQREKLTASDGAAGDWFGLPVSVSGDIAVVGARRNDAAGTDAGAVYVFSRNGTNWPEEVKLVAPDAAAGDEFGVAAAVRGDRLLVGAFGDDDVGVDAGSAYMYLRRDTQWSPHGEKITAGGVAGSSLGVAVALSGSDRLVGAYTHPGKGAGAGAASLSRFSSGEWGAGSGDSALHAADCDWSGLVRNSGTGSLILEPSTSSTIGLGGAVGGFELADDEIATLADGFSSITVGDPTAGDIQFETATFLDPLTLISGGNISDADDAGTDMIAPIVTLDGDVSAGAPAGILAIDGDLTLADNASFTVNLEGLTPGVGGTNQLDVVGRILIGTSVTLNIIQTSAFEPEVGDRFTLIQNDGADGVMGRFEGLAEGDALAPYYTISYVGGDGNDVVIETVAVPDPPQVVINAAGELEFRVDSGRAFDDQVTLSWAGGHVRLHCATSSLLAGAGMTQVDGSTVDIPIPLITGSAIRVNGQGGDDHLNLDLSGGLPPFPVIYVGGAQGAGGDSLSLSGGSATDLTFNYINAHDGDVVLDGTVLISYTGLEPIFSTITATNVILNYSDAAETITVRECGMAGSTTVASTAGEATTFINPTGSLTLNAGAGGGDDIELAGLGTGFAADLNIDGGAGIGDTLTVTGEIQTRGGDVSFVAGGGVTLTRLVDTAGGDFVVNADRDDDGVGAFTVSPYGVEAPPELPVTLTPPSGSEFGRSVAISGNTAVVGDPEGGAVYVFVRQGGSWIQQAELLAPFDENVYPYLEFGGAVDICGDTILVGGRHLGAVYVYTRNGTVWTMLETLTPSDAYLDFSYLFGYSVAIDGDTLVVGSYAGSAYVFSRSGRHWTEEFKLGGMVQRLPPYPVAHSVSICGDDIVVGTFPQYFFSFFYRPFGFAHVFTRIEGGWAQQGTLPDLPRGAGVSVSIDGDTLVVGTKHLVYGGTSGVDTFSGAYSGTAEIYERSGTNWTHQVSLQDPDGAISDGFGHSVSVENDVVVVGVPSGFDAGLKVDDFGLFSPKLRDSIHSGFAYMYKKEEQGWLFDQKLEVADADAYDGVAFSVDLDDGTIIAGAPSNPIFSFGGDGGSAYIFDLPREVSWRADSGDSVIQAASVEWGGASLNSGTGKLVIQPSTGLSIGLGGGPSVFNLTDDEIATLAGGFESITIGGPTAGDIQVDTATFLDPLILISGGTISDVSYTGTDIIAPSVRLVGGVAPGAPTGLLAIEGDLTLADNASFTVDLEGRISRTGASTGNPWTGRYEQLDVVGGITLGTNVTLGIVQTGAFVPENGDRFTLILNDGSDGVIGSFEGLAEGGVVAPYYSISYVGGDGNDVVLETVSAPDPPQVVINASGEVEFRDDPSRMADDRIVLSWTGERIRFQSYTSSLRAGTGMTQVNGSTVDVPTPLITGSAIRVDALAGDDHLTLDLSGGLLPFPVTYVGGDQRAGSDSLSLFGGSATNLIFNYFNAHDGDVWLDGSQLISYTDLEPIYSTVTAANIFLNYSDAAETITVSDSGTVGSTTAVSTAAETTTFTNPTGSLTLNAGAGGVDAIELEGLGYGFAADLTVDGGAGTGDTLTVIGPIGTGGGDIDLAVGGGITFYVLVDTGGGELNLNADSDDDGVGAFVLSNESQPVGTYRRTTLATTNEYGFTEFGGVVALSGDTLVVGEVLPQAKVYIYTRSETGWHLQTTLMDPSEEFGFASALAIDGDTLVVGDPNAAKVHVYTRNGAVWSPQAELTTASYSASPASRFGRSVSVSGDTVAVGSGEDSGYVHVFVRSGSSNWTENAVLRGDYSYYSSVVVDGDTLVVDAPSYGSVYVFSRNSTNWTQQAYLQAPSQDRSNHRGASVDLDNDTIVLVDPYRNRAHVFGRYGTNWVQEAELDTGEYFRAVSIDGDVLVVSGGLFDQGSTAHVFGRSGTNWTKQAELQTHIGHGAVVAVSGETIVMGQEAWFDDRGFMAVEVFEPGKVGSWNTGAGSCIITAATIDWNSSLKNLGQGTLALHPSTAASVGLGGGVGTFNLDDAEIDQLADGFESITIGHPTAGDIEVDTATFLDPLTLISGGTISDANDAGADIVAPSVSLVGGVAPGASPGILVVEGDLTFGGGALNLELGGTEAGTNGYDQVSGAGSIVIDTNVQLNLVQYGAFVPALDDTFTLVENGGRDPVSGSFAGLPEGAEVSAGLFGSGRRFFISYTGGDGNDVVLYSAPVTAAESFERAADSGLTVSEGQITGNDQSSGGGALTVTSVGPAASGKATVVLQDGSIIYQPDPGFTGADSFPVTVSEAGGGSSVSRVTITVIGDETLHRNVTASFVENQATLKFSGIPGRSYTFYYAANTWPEELTWRSGGPMVCGPDGFFTVDHAIQYPGGELYRISLP